jgi:hypothetical protein
VPASVALVETKELAIVPPSEAVRTAVMETKVEDVVTVPGVNPLPSPVWRRMMSWIAHRMGED